jgi:hypothetical protein
MSPLCAAILALAGLARAVHGVPAGVKKETHTLKGFGAPYEFDVYSSTNAGNAPAPLVLMLSGYCLVRQAVACVCPRCADKRVSRSLGCLICC